MKEVIKKFGLYFISILFLEIAFKLIMHIRFDLQGTINILLYTIIISSVLSITSNMFNKIVSTIFTSINLFVIGLLFSIQCVFHNVFKVYFSLTNLGLGDQLTSFMDETINAILENILYIIIFMLPFIIYLIFKKKLDLKKNTLNSYIAYLSIIAISLALLVVNVVSTRKKDHDLFDLYFNVNEVSLNVNRLGVLNSYFLDFNRMVFGFKEKINKVNMDDIHKVKEKEKTKEKEEKPIVYEPNKLELNFKETNNSSINTINNYIENDTPTMKNKYTGIFKDYNLIYITAESFSEIGISEELTPTLYKLTHSGFMFDSFYTPNNLSTIGGEFQSLLGLYPDSSILTKWRSGNNYFPNGLGYIYKNLGYNTFAYHNNSYVFQDRNKYLKSQGFDNFLGCYNGLEKRMNCKAWPQSDDQMMEVTIPDYINSEQPFLAYYMTVSGHFGYNFVDNAMATKNKSYVKDLDLPETAKGYVATQIELDRALERLLNELEKAGKLDKTVIVLLADHYPYELDLNSINSLSTFDRDETVGVNHNALIIWNKNLEDLHISKPCMATDVLPTVYNLFGIDYDSRIFTGKDILSDSFGIAIMRDRSWITDKGIYYASSRKFEGEEVDENYVSNVNNLVNNRLNISKLIISTDYYSYLYK